MVAPYGCNMCGGIISESLVQMLAAEGLESADRRSFNGGSTPTFSTPTRRPSASRRRCTRSASEPSIAAPVRAIIKEFKWHSFDGHLLAKASHLGANVIPQRVSKVERIRRALWTLTDHEGETPHLRPPRRGDRYQRRRSQVVQGSAYRLSAP